MTTIAPDFMTDKEILIVKLNQNLVLTSEEIEEGLKPHSSSDTLHKIVVQIMAQSYDEYTGLFEENKRILTQVVQHPHIAEHTLLKILEYDNPRIALSACQYAKLTDDMVSSILRKKSGLRDTALAVNTNLEDAIYYKLYKRYNQTSTLFSFKSKEDPFVKYSEQVLDKLSKNPNLPLKLALEIMKTHEPLTKSIYVSNKNVDVIYKLLSTKRSKYSIEYVNSDELVKNPYISTGLLNKMFKKAYSRFRKDSYYDRSVIEEIAKHPNVDSKTCKALYNILKDEREDIALRGKLFKNLILNPSADIRVLEDAIWAMRTDIAFDILRDAKEKDTDKIFLKKLSSVLENDVSKSFVKKYLEFCINECSRLLEENAPSVHHARSFAHNCIAVAANPQAEEKDLLTFVEAAYKLAEENKDPEKRVARILLDKIGGKAHLYNAFETYLKHKYDIDISGLPKDMIVQLLGWEKEVKSE
jgi:uncharacterized protein (UPF0147 family)